jgi:phospholipid/cholesterol/gamma-HCH transport system permease protein
MQNSSLKTDIDKDRLILHFIGEFDLYLISEYDNQLKKLNYQNINIIEFDLTKLEFIDTAASIFIKNKQTYFYDKNIKAIITSPNTNISDTLSLVKTVDKKIDFDVKKNTLLESIGITLYLKYNDIKSFLFFLGQLFISFFHYIIFPKSIRLKEILFEINESAIKAIGIISLTSFLIGLVIAYQSAYQLKIYGANIFIVDMLGISILRELSPLITAIVIAGRSGSAFTAQIGAMKITQELDAMQTMGFDPYRFLVLPRIIALIIIMPIMIFLSDMMALLGGMIIANIDLSISIELFIERFNNVIDIKHFYVGMIKGPFFAFLIASIGIYRGLMVKDDTQSIGFNTTKSVVESIFAVIICDAIFSIAFTNLGI